MMQLIVSMFLFSFYLGIKSNQQHSISYNKIGIQKDTLSVKIIPKEAIRFEFDYAKRIHLNVILNDSISERILFDSGYKEIGFVDSLYDILPKNITIKANHYNYKCFKTSKMKRSTYSIIGYDFFDGKIMEINYREKYLLEHDDIKDFRDYDCVKIQRDKRGLLLPMIIHVQGKSIGGNFILDTGSGGAIIFSKPVLERYSIDTLKLGSSRVGNADGWHKSYHTVSDTIRAGSSFVTGEYVIFLNDRQFYDNKNHIGLLGNDFLTKFSIILDLKHDYLYLKKYN